jgi:hypothetical protein
VAGFEVSGLKSSGGIILFCAVPIGLERDAPTTRPSEEYNTKWIEVLFVLAQKNLNSKFV